jgi:hypothetical protein
MALFRKAESIADTANNWRADVVESFQTSGRGMNLRDEVHIKIAAQAPLKVRRENSDGDQTVLVCDGDQAFQKAPWRSSCKPLIPGPETGSVSCAKIKCFWHRPMVPLFPECSTGQSQLKGFKSFWVRSATIVHYLIGKVRLHSHNLQRAWSCITDERRSPCGSWSPIHYKTRVDG